MSNGFFKTEPCQRVLQAVGAARIVAIRFHNGVAAAAGKAHPIGHGAAIPAEHSRTSMRIALTGVEVSYRIGSFIWSCLLKAVPEPEGLVPCLEAE